jgi:outer membrane protein
MKSIIKSFAFIAFLLCGLNSSAQKFAHINSQELLMSMPESDSAQIKIEQTASNYEDQLEEMQVELNKKYDDYLKNRDKYTELIRQTKESEIADMQERYQQFESIASQELQTERNRLLQPIIEKANKAIKEVAEEQNIMYVFDVSQGNPIYFSEQSTDILPLVKKKLGLE